MIEDVLERTRAGKIRRRNLDGLRRSKYRGQKEAVRQVEDVALETGQAGITDSEGELERQEGAEE